MQDGEYVIYTIQYKWVAQSPWLKPKEPLEPIKKKQDWSFVGCDAFGIGLDPHNNDARDFKFKFPKSHDELGEVHRKTGYAGWYDLKFAIKATKRLQQCDAKGKFDSFDGYRVHCQAIRHEFRIMKITLKQKTEVLEMKDVIAAV